MMKETDKIFIKVCVAFLFISALFSDPSPAQTEDECVKVALDNNPKLLLLREDMNISKLKTAQASALFKPKVYLGAYYDYYSLDYPSIFSSSIGAFNLQQASDNFYGTRLTLTQPLYTGGENRAIEKQAAQRVLETRSAYEEAKNKVILDVRTGYVKVFYLKKKIEIVSNSLDSLDKIKGAAAAELAFKLKKLKLELKKSLNREIYSFNAAVSSQFIEEDKLDQTPEIDKNLLGEDKTRLILIAQQNRPELKSMKAKESVDSLSVGLEKALKFPNVDFFSKYDYLHARGSEWETNFQVGISMMLPLFNGGAGWQKYMEGESMLQKTKIIASSGEDAVKRQVQESYGRLELLQDEYDLASARKNSFVMPSRMTPDDIDKWRTVMSGFLDAEENLIIACDYLKFVTGSEISKY